MDSINPSEPAVSKNSLSDRIEHAIFEEIGGYEMTHPAMSGAAAAIHARVMIEIAEHKEESKGISLAMSEEDELTG